MRKSVVWKSLLEFDYIYLLELDSQIRHYETCDFKIAYLFRGQEKYLQPHFVVQGEEYSTLIYLLPTQQKSDEYFQEISLVSKLCKANGYILEVVSESETHRQPRLDNAKLILKYATKTIDNPHSRLLCYRFFENKSQVSIGELTNYFKQNSAFPKDIFRLIFLGVLKLYINQPINADAFICRLNYCSF